MPVVRVQAPHSVNIYQLIRLMCREIPRNKQENGLKCPFCTGGKHGERSLSVFHRHDGVCLYICHRASCGASGRVLLNGTVSSGEEKDASPSFIPRPFNEETRTPSAQERELLHGLYGLTQREINWYGITVAKNTEDLVVPICGSSGQKRGHTTKIFGKPRDLPIRPKNLNYKVLDEPWLGWFWTEASKPERIVVVEDVFSAMRVARHYFGIALLGTNMSRDDLFEILKGSDNIVLALDRDATTKALEYQAKYKFIAPQMQVAILEKDLKSCTDLEILEKVA